MSQVQEIDDRSEESDEKLKELKDWFVPYVSKADVQKENDRDLQKKYLKTFEAMTHEMLNGKVLEMKQEN